MSTPLVKAVEKLDEIIYFARTNADAGKDKDAWEAHVRGCTEVRNLIFNSLATSERDPAEQK